MYTMPPVRVFLRKHILLHWRAKYHHHRHHNYRTHQMFAAVAAAAAVAAHLVYSHRQIHTQNTCAKSTLVDS